MIDLVGKVNLRTAYACLERCKLFVGNDSNADQIPINNYNFHKKIELDNKEVYFGIRPEHINYKKSNEEDFEIKLKAELSEYIGNE